MEKEARVRERKIERDPDLTRKPDPTGDLDPVDTRVSDRRSGHAWFRFEARETPMASLPP